MVYSLCITTVESSPIMNDFDCVLPSETKPNDWYNYIDYLIITVMLSIVIPICSGSLCYRSQFSIPLRLGPFKKLLTFYAKVGPPRLAIDM